MQHFKMGTSLHLALPLHGTARSRRTAAAASLFFIASPCSVFYSAAYTESLFTLLTLAGLCVLYVPAGTATAAAADPPDRSPQQQAGQQRLGPGSKAGGGADPLGVNIPPGMARASGLQWLLRMCGAAAAFGLATCTRANGKGCWQRRWMEGYGGRATKVEHVCGKGGASMLGAGHLQLVPDVHG